MRRHKTIFVCAVLFCTAILTACSGGIDYITEQTVLPENPKSIVIEWHEGGGMLPEGQDIYISKDSSYYSLWQNQRHQKMYFTTSDEELKSLYQIFVEHDFSNIRLIEEQEVYDRGGTSIRLVADGKNYNKNNSGMTFLHENDVDAYFEIETAVYDFAMLKIEDQKINLEISIDQSVLNCPYSLYLALNQNTLVDVEDSVINQTYQAEVYAGQNEIDLGLYYKDSNDYYGYPAMFSREYPIIEVSDSSNHVKIKYNSKTKMLEVVN